ncbi:MAG: beta-ketoacyl-[acyl-carrier-protein] synthase family protein [Planctomycetaceae bacterium]|nr:beta-ketoacyl-[acyl-carrier-protein] synthase family protein [Planctomycetaceae bacterium]
MKHRVVITGMGVVSPIGVTIRSFQEAMFAGKSGVGPIQLFDPGEFPCRIAAEVKDLVCTEFRDRRIGFAMEAAEQAIQDAGLADSAVLRSAGLSLGIGLEVLDLQDLLTWSRGANAQASRWHEKRLTFLQTPSDLCAHLISHRYGFEVPPQVHVSACAAGTDAIGAAFQEIRSGRRKVMLAGGTDSMINPLGVGGFCKLRALSTRNECPTQASRPFDRDRDGFVLGEGAGLLILENRETATARQAHIHAEIAGYGNSMDAYGISEPHPEGRGALQAMTRALSDAGICPEQIDAINAHGSSTPKNDVMETIAIRKLLGDRAGSVPVVSTKSMIGHLIAAAGAVEVIAATLCLKTGHVHPTLNLTVPDPDCDLDYAPGSTRVHPQRYSLSNSFAFGGQNAALVLRRKDVTDS